MADHQSENEKPEASENSGGHKINLENFANHLKAFYTHWKEHNTNFWGVSDAVAVATPPTSQDIRYLKSSALYLWLIGYELPETIIVFMREEIHFLCNQKNATLLDNLKKPAKEAVGADVVIHVKAENDEGVTFMESILCRVHVHSNSDIPVLGYIAKEAPEGKLLNLWSEILNSSTLQLSDVTNGFSELFAVKDAMELTVMRKSAYITSAVMENFVVRKLEKIDQETSHSALADGVEKAIQNPQSVKVKLKAGKVDICYPPIFQSGGKFDLSPTASSNDNILCYDSNSVIICAFGSRYNNFCSNVARTFLFDANIIQSKAYTVLLKAHDATIGALKQGNKVSAAYQAAVTVVEKEAPDLIQNMTKSAGTGIGLEFCESWLEITLRNDRLLKAGMVFNVSLGFRNLKAETNNPKTNEFSLFLADTVLVVTDNPPQVLTSLCSKDVKDVAYSFSQDGEEVQYMSTKTLRSGNPMMWKEKLRRRHQAELAQQKNKETEWRLAGGSGTGDGSGLAKVSSEVVAYKSVNDIPCSKELAIQVDQKNEAILLPIYGSMVPFHVSMVKSVTNLKDNWRCMIRIMFNTSANDIEFRGAIYLKEITFRLTHSSKVVRLIRALRRKVAKRAKRATFVPQEQLKLSGNRMQPVRLSDLWIRPPFGGRGRKLTGTLEAHANGFRYSTSRFKECVDIMYRNIKHAFFQPSEREMVTLLHLHLYNHIMVSSKNAKDVQFYVDVIDEPCETREEQRALDQKNKVKMDFRSFINKVNDICGLEFEEPLRELGFQGVAYRDLAFIVPTSCCLVELIQMPSLVITLSEIEIVSLERVGKGMKNFDMTIVFKNFKKDVFRIDSIPTTSLIGIEEWLDASNLKYYKSRMNLNWRPILKQITDNPEKFIINGGWEFLNLEASDPVSDNSQDSDNGNEPSNVESGSESSEDDGTESLVESGDDEGEPEEERGKSLDELEWEASDAERESVSEQERKRRKLKALRKLRAPDSKHTPAKRSKMRKKWNTGKGGNTHT